jgi:hypothetical protein
MTKEVIEGTITYQLQLHRVIIPSGRCEKIDLETWSNFGLEKNRARMPYKRLPGLRHTFRLRRNFSQIDFFTSSCHQVLPSFGGKDTAG